MKKSYATSAQQASKDPLVLTLPGGAIFSVASDMMLLFYSKTSAAKNGHANLYSGARYTTAVNAKELIEFGTGTLLPRDAELQSMVPELNPQHVQKVELNESEHKAGASISQKARHGVRR